MRPNWERGTSKRKKTPPSGVVKGKNMEWERKKPWETGGKKVSEGIFDDTPHAESWARKRKGVNSFVKAPPSQEEGESIWALPCVGGGSNRPRRENWGALKGFLEKSTG